MGVETPTLGRDAELAQIRALFHRAVRDRTPQVVSIVGGPGVGKTRIKHELRLFVEGLGGEVVPIEGHGEPMSARSPYAVYSLALRRVAKIEVGEPEELSQGKLVALFAEAFGDSSGHAATAAALVGGLIGVSFPMTGDEAAARDPRRARERAEEALVAWFHALASKRTVMLVLEDAHWADPFSLELTERMVAQGEGRPIFVLVLARPELFEARSALFGGCDHQRVDLRPLTRRAGRELMRALLGGEPPSGLEESIAELTGGNPYFIEESLAALRDRGALIRDRAGFWQLVEDPASGPVPASVEAVLQSRLDSLPPEEKELLKRASVFGRAFWDEALGSLGVAEGARLLGNLRSRDLVMPRSPSRFAGVRELTFRHALMRDTAYALLPEAQRRVLHRAAAQFFLDRGDEDAAAIARHLDLGGDMELSATYHLKAAVRARGEDAAEMALEHAERGLCLTSDPALRFDLFALEVEVLDRLGRRNEQRRALERLPELAQATGDRWREALWRMRMGQMQRMTAEYALAAGNLATALALFQQLGRAADAIEALTELGAVAQAVGDYRQALDHVDDALELCASERRPDLEATAQMVAANALLGLQELEQARTRYSASVECFRDLGDGYRETLALVNLGNLYNALGLYEDAARSFEVAFALASRTGALSTEAYIHANMGVSQARLGQLDAAVESEQIAFKTAGEIGDARLLSACGAYLALICVERGGDRDLHRAQNAAVAALSAARDASLEEFQALARMALARVFLARGETEAALKEAGEAVRLRDRMRGAQEREEDLYFTHHLALKAAGRTDEAAAALSRARDLILQKASKLTQPEIRRSYLDASRPILGETQV
ncbi:MAG: AAA family ATPase [Deltaproteobacteria bacterium]|nr:AAA family ATPase [Deltaproteobacteria bacterium]